MRRFHCAVWFAAVLCLICLAGAAHPTGLAAFGVERRFDGTVFPDVAGTDWFVAGVKTVYETGIMDGVGGGQFAPLGTVTRAEAVTLAARVHAAYHGKTISVQKGEWYETYTVYAEKNDLLPADAHDNWAAEADRGYIAFLFSKAVDADDLPAVNLTAEIPDLDDIPAAYRDAAALLYRGGVLTGKPGGYFDSNAAVTRAELATAAMRLLTPPERVSSDPRLEAAYVAQQFNYMNGTPVCKTEDGYVALAANPSGEAVLRLFGGTRDAELRCAAEYDEIAYFNQTLYAHGSMEVGTGRSRTVHAAIYRIDLTARTQQQIALFFDPSGKANFYSEGLFYYDGTLYALIREFDAARKPESTTYLYRIDGNGMHEQLCAVDAPYLNGIGAFDRQIIFGGLAGIYSYDLRTAQLRKVLEGVNTFVLDGNTILCADRSGNLTKVALTAPHLPRHLTNIGETYEYIDGINRYDGALYVTDHKGWLGRYTDDGTFARVAYLDTHGYRFGVLGAQFFVTDFSGAGSPGPAKGRIGDFSHPDSLIPYLEWCHGRHRQS